MIALSWFSGLSKDKAVRLLVPCAATPAWGETLVNLRPPTSRHVLLQIVRETMDYWGENELDAALSVHPWVDEEPTGGQAHTALSRQEQSAADSENERLAQALQEGDACYEARSGRVFLVRTEGRSGETILQALTRRLQYTVDEKVTEALAQLREITILRLEGMTGERVP